MRQESNNEKRNKNRTMRNGTRKHHACRLHVIARQQSHKTFHTLNSLRISSTALGGRHRWPRYFFAAQTASFPLSPRRYASIYLNDLFANLFKPVSGHAIMSASKVIVPTVSLILVGLAPETRAHSPRSRRSLELVGVRGIAACHIPNTSR